MPQPFAKLFETEEFGQILVMLQEDDEDRPEIRFTVHPDGLGLCSVGIAYPDSERGLAAAERSFSNVDEALAIETSREIFKTALPLRGINQEETENA